MVKRVLVSLQALEQEPQEGTKEAITFVPLFIPLPPLTLFQTTPSFYSLTTEEPNPFRGFSQISLKVSYNEFRAFKELKFVAQAKCKI